MASGYDRPRGMAAFSAWGEAKPQSRRVPLKVNGIIPVITMGWSDGALRVMVVSMMPPVGMTTIWVALFPRYRMTELPLVDETIEAGIISCTVPYQS